MILLNNKGHNNLGDVIFLALLIIFIGGLIDLGLISLALISFLKWKSMGFGVILLISVIVVSFAGYFLLKRIG